MLLRDAARLAGRATVALLGWLAVAPLAWAWPRRGDWIAVIGREDGQFVDNAKYFLLQAAPLAGPGVRVAYVTEREGVIATLAGTDYEAVRYPSARAAWFLLRCGIVVVDSSEWYRRFRRFLLVGARSVQLWHGVGFKRIGLDLWRNPARASRVLGWPPVRWVRRWLHTLTGRLVHYDVVNTTSAFYRDEVFRGAFLADHFTTFGYPRNAFGAPGAGGQALAWSNVERAVADALPGWIAAGRRLVLFAPTFRDSRAAPLGLDTDTLRRVDAFCDEHGFEFVFKFHPFERGVTAVQGRHLHRCASDTDLYPLMPHACALVTDYSSIYMDFLLLDRPVLFLVPDLAQYRSQDRQLQFDFEAMTPGPKVATWDELLVALAGGDTPEQARERSRVRTLAFDSPQAEAVPRLLEFLRQRGWLVSAGDAG